MKFDLGNPLQKSAVFCFFGLGMGGGGGLISNKANFGRVMQRV